MSGFGTSPLTKEANINIIDVVTEILWNPLRST
jgi:hypothetical protein